MPPITLDWLSEPHAWMPDAYDEDTRGAQRLASLRRVVYRRETPQPLPSDETAPP